VSEETGRQRLPKRLRIPGVLTVASAALVATIEPLVELGEPVDQTRARRMHDVVRVALQQRHQGLGPAERLELSRAHHALQPVAAAR
jgi:hypothetical protein